MAYFMGLSEKGRQVWHVLYRGVKEGLSGTEIMRILREQGLGYRLADFYNDLRLIKGETLKHETMKYVRRDYIISERLYTPSPHTGKFKFITNYRIDYIDLITGEKGTMYTSIGHDAPMRRKDLDELALQTAGIRLPGYEGIQLYEITRVIPVGGYKRI